MNRTRFTRAISAVLAAFILLAAVPAFAITLPKPQATATPAPSADAHTDKRNIAEFMNLYTRRYLEALDQYNIKEDRNAEFYITFKSGDRYNMTANDMIIILDQNDLSIELLRMPFGESDQNIVSAIAAISALEYDFTSEGINKAGYSSGLPGYQKNVFETCLHKIDEIYTKILKDGSLEQANGSVPVMEGNYDYYLERVVIKETGYESVSLVCQTK